ncbi:MAG: RagB/SusD family nutrient uptake outer membrane protein, partial [Candidatus Methylomirabilaceae bacterium]
WNVAFTGIARANVLLDALTRVTVPNQATIVAELRTLRGFYYFILMDMFGGVQIVTDLEIKPRPRNTRADVFDFIESELLDARTALPDNWPAESNGRLTKGAADAILASMYLNAGVWTRETGVSAASYNTCLGVQVSGGVDACQAAIDAADRIINSGQYSLAANWRSNFTADNQTSPENIMVVKFLNEAGLGLNFVMRALHYNQLTNATPWNGFATLAQTYNAFDANDQRRQMWLAGPQTNVETGVPVNDRAGNPLVFTVTINDVTAATEGEGARVYKWPADPNRAAGEINGNDFAYFRLAEIHLIKAEALNEQSAGSAAALALVNALRARVFNPAQPRAAIDRAALLEERLFELAAENKRRQDLIRHGRFTDPWEFKTAGTPNLILMPIPQPQLDANPLLVQNPGY